MELAARQLTGFPHSIGQLVFHMNYWMDYELRRIRGERPAYPRHSSESFPLAPSPADAQDWDQLRKRLAGLLADFTALAKSSPEEMQRQIETVHEGDTKLAGTLRGRALADGRAQQLPRGTDRDDAARAWRLATTRGRGQLVRVIGL